MTNEEKQGLIQECEKEIERISAILATGSVSSGFAKAYQMEVRIKQIALTALTAPPIKLPENYGYEHPEKEEPFYTLNKNEVIATLRASGYEVQE